MHTVPTFAFELLVIFAIATGVVIIFHYLRQPVVAGFILSGVLVGPYGLKLISDLDRVGALVEIGVILLLFSLGVEFSIKKLRSMSRAFFGVGLLQCLLTTVFSGLVLWLLIPDPKVAGIVGACVSLSSTAIVLKVLQERRELTSAHGKVTIAVLLFQDLWVVPVLMILPLLKGEAGTSPLASLGTIAINMVGLAGAVFVLTRYVVPLLLKSIARTQMRELFFITVGLIAFGSAFLTSMLGLSTALGAFIAGVMLADSDYGHQAVADVVPLRDPFVALFFISVGMLLDWRFLVDHLFGIGILATGTLVGKFCVAAFSARLLGYEGRVSGLVGLSLAQIGEFSFVVAHKAHDIQILSMQQYQYLLAVTLVLMSITPTLLKYAPRVAPAMDALEIVPRILRKRQAPVEASEKDGPSGHVIVIGHGVNGVLLTNALSEVGVPFVLIELNPDSVRVAKKKGLQVVYGDASRPEILETAGLERARMVVVCASDAAAIDQIVLAVRKLRSDIHVLVRSHFFKAVEKLGSIGASDLVVGELETGFEIVSRVLRHYAIDEEQIERCIDAAQDQRYPSVRQYVRQGGGAEASVPGWLKHFETRAVKIAQESSVLGHELRSINALGGALAVGLEREGVGVRLADASTTIEAGDTIFLVGEASELEKVAAIVRGD